MKPTALLAGWLVFLSFVSVAAARTIPVNTCVGNLVQIDGAAKQWALERKLTATNKYSFEDPTLLAYLKGSVLPKCPSGGRYFPSATIAGSPRCTLHGEWNHPIDAERALWDYQGRGENHLAIVVAMCGLLFAFLGRELSESKRASVRIVIALIMLFGLGRSLNMLLTHESRSAYPILPILIYSTAGALAFGSLRGEPRKFVRVLVFIGTGVLGALALLLLLVGFGVLPWADVLK